GTADSRPPEDAIRCSDEHQILRAVHGPGRSDIKDGGLSCKLRDGPVPPTLEVTRMRLALLASSTLLGMLLALPTAAEPATTTTAPGGREVRVELVAQYADNMIGNDKVHLRSYNGALVGPTIRARAGDTLNIHLVNRLPPNPPTLNNVEVQAAELAR